MRIGGFVLNGSTVVALTCMESLKGNAPIIDWNKMKEDEHSMDTVVQYLDSLVTTINPGLDAPIPACHLPVILVV